MILLPDYFGKFEHHTDVTDEIRVAAVKLLERVNPLLDDAYVHGVDLLVNPVTQTHVSGTQYGGFRPQACPEGAPQSSHKQGRGVDVYDPHDDLDKWITDKILEKYGLYREAPLSTRGWVHLTDRAPGSGRRTFNP